MHHPSTQTKVHFKICPFVATFPDMLTQIEIRLHSANIPGHCVWIDTPHAYVWMTWNFHFLMGRTCFEINFPPAKILWNPFLAKYPISLHKIAAKNASGFLKTLWLTFLTRPNGQCRGPGPLGRCLGPFKPTSQATEPVRHYSGPTGLHWSGHWAQPTKQPGLRPDRSGSNNWKTPHHTSD